MTKGFEVQEKMCETCIFKKSSPLNNNIETYEREALEDNTYRVCHHSETACCNGYWNKHKNNFNLGRIAQRLKVVKFVDHDNMKIFSENFDE